MARLSTQSHSQLQVDDGFLIALAKQGNAAAYDRLVRRYYGFVRLKASSYFLAGGDGDDLIQEGLVGLYKAVRDFRYDRESSFRNFAELCITRQIITAIKSATRQKHAPLNSYVSLSRPAPGEDDERPLDESLAAGIASDPVELVISAEEIADIRASMARVLSVLETEVLALYMDGKSYQEIADMLGRHVKSIDNALQRIKRKLEHHLAEAQV